MNVYEFDVTNPVNYILTGKFEAPSPEWSHENFPLNDYELFVITKDTLYISYNQKQYQVTEGEYLLLPPLPSPGNRRVGFRSSNCSFYWLHFSTSHDTRQSIIPNEEHPIYPYETPDGILAFPGQSKVMTSKIVILMKQLQDAVRNNYNSTALNYLTTTILCELHNQLFSVGSNGLRARQGQKQLYYDIIDYVRDNTHRTLKVADVALHFGYNAKYLSHLFSDITGIPLKQFILNVKMDAASFLLTNTNDSINDIAITLGFSDGHNFAKAYKKIAGLTPSEYRNAYYKRLLYHV